MSGQSPIDAAEDTITSAGGAISGKEIRYSGSDVEVLVAIQWLVKQEGYRWVDDGAKQ